MQKISEEGLALLKRLEGRRLTAYQCDAGVWTIGYGSTGDDIVEGLEITEAEAEKMLKKDLRRFEKSVRATYSPMKQNVFDALTIFSFNIGVAAYENSTAYKRIVGKGSKLDVVFQIKRWCYVNKLRNKGLVKRRNAESCVYLSSNYHNFV